MNERSTRSIRVNMTRPLQRTKIAFVRPVKVAERKKEKIDLEEGTKNSFDWFNYSRDCHNIIPLGPSNIY